MIDPVGHDLVQRRRVDELPVDGVESPEGEPDEHPDGEGETGEEEILQTHQAPLDRRPPAADEVVDLREDILLSLELHW